MTCDKVSPKFVGGLCRECRAEPKGVMHLVQGQGYCAPHCPVHGAAIAADLEREAIQLEDSVWDDAPKPAYESQRGFVSDSRFGNGRVIPRTNRETTRKWRNGT